MKIKRNWQQDGFFLIEIILINFPLINKSYHEEVKKKKKQEIEMS
jgi:hypothetical protein